MFIKELELYVDYLQKDITAHIKGLSDKKRKQLDKFKFQLQEGIKYYKTLFNQLPEQTTDLIDTWLSDLALFEIKLSNILIV